MAQTSESSSAPRRHSIRRKLLFSSLATTLFVLLLEGLLSVVWTACSLASFWSTAPRVAELREEFHCKYDSELGWVNRPSVQLTDFYGPGRTITINAIGVRGREDYQTASDDNRFRTICLGDSFTLGYGVDDRETIPFLLEQQVTGPLQVVNMGQGGYSIGQCWLWLRRLTPALEPDAVVCIFIVEDFRRLGTNRTANGFGTPGFAVINERVQLRGIPVPSRLSQGTLLIRQGQLADVLKRNSSIARMMAQAVPSDQPSTDEETTVLGLYVVKEIEKLCQVQDCPMAFVLTPTLTELFHDDAAVKYQRVSRMLARFLEEEDIPYLDLHGAFSERQNQAGKLFLEEAFHHYSPTGNALVARELSQWLPSVMLGFPTEDNP